MPPGNSARTISGIAMNFCPPSTGLMSSSATSITSTLRRSLKILTTRRICFSGTLRPPWSGPQFCRWRVTDTGPLKKPDGNVDLEFLDTAQQFIQRAAEEDKPFFVWFNSTRMHFWTIYPRRREGCLVRVLQRRHGGPR